MKKKKVLRIITICLAFGLVFMCMWALVVPISIIFARAMAIVGMITAFFAMFAIEAWKNEDEKNAMEIERLKNKRRLSTHI